MRSGGDQVAQHDIEPARAAGRPARLSRDQRRVVHAATIGFFVDVVDIYLPTVVLAPAMAYFQPPGSAVATSTTMFYVVFAVTLLARPVGSVIFGHIADSVGRRAATTIAIPGVAVCTLLTAALPGYAAWGIGAYVLLTVIRFVGGIFMGGATAGLTPLAMEVTPKPMRGLVGGYTNIGYPLGAATISLVTTVMLKLVPAHGAGSPYVEWGWRIPFIFGGLLALAYVVYFRRVVGESPLWQGASTGSGPKRRPLAELMRGRNRRSLLQVLLLMTGIWMGFHAITSAVSGVLVTYLDRPASTVTSSLMIANVVLAACYFGYAVLGQRIGRRRLLIGGGVSVATLGAGLYAIALANADHGGSLAITMVLVGVCMVLATGLFPVVCTYITERFPTEVRSTGWAVGYQVAVILPSLYSFYMLGLGNLMPYVYTPVVLVVIGGVIVAIGAWLGPETRDIDLEEVR
ncbi:MFS transporter [Amycolatopsis taiwanensis]|uniref:MFS transporter n=1 Tax=Amycolatopsis taiwanensis TaxID=342230 RepID=UPI00047F19EA|nr:MFS transporter [Amycolatopsis taiwanensis]